MKPLHRSQRRRPPSCRHTGFALIEVLVSLLIFMFAVLGLVGLQANMTQAQGSAKMRTDAAYLARELLGRMWTDMPNRTLYSSANCALHNLCKDWTDKVAQSLPHGSSNVDFNAGTGDVLIELSWSTPDGESHTYTTRSTVVPSE